MVEEELDLFFENEIIEVVLDFFGVMIEVVVKVVEKVFGDYGWLNVYI